MTETHKMAAVGKREEVNSQDIQKEAQESTMTHDDLHKLFDTFCGVLKEQTIVKGTIVKVTSDEVFVDIGYKSEGIIPIDEFRDISQYTVGETIDVFLETLEDQDGMVVISKQKADRIQNWEKTITCCEEGKTIQGKIYKKVKGGLMVDVGMDAFLPASQVDLQYHPDMDSYVGRVFEFKVIKINAERKNIVLSRRQLLEDQRKKDREGLLQQIKVGDIRTGAVKNITDFGVFVDLNGIDGLLHITDMTWGRISHPSEMLKVGDSVDVMIIGIDKEKERVSLGLKQKTQNPWESIGQKYPVGNKVQGKVVNIMPYGAFVELEEGIEGLIHISELSWTRRINHPSEVLSVGDVVEVMVLNIDKDSKKISLGIKQTEFNPWTVIDQKYPVGSRVHGRVRNITPYGVFLELEEGIDGLIHVSDLSWTKKITHPSEFVKKGDELDAVVLNVDRDNKKIALGLKQLTDNPWDAIEERFKVGDAVAGKITKITNFGAFLELGDGIEGLIHISQISTDNIKKVEDFFSVGQEINAKIIKVDKQEKRIALSTRYSVDSPDTGVSSEVSAGESETNSSQSESLES